MKNRLICHCIIGFSIFLICQFQLIGVENKNLVTPAKIHGATVVQLSASDGANTVEKATGGENQKSRFDISPKALAGISEEDMYKSLAHSKGFQTLIRTRLKTPLNESGAIGRNREKFSEVSTQRDAIWLMRMGLTNDDESMIEAAVKAMEYAFGYITPAGNFRNERNMDPVTALTLDAFFMHGFGHIYLLVSQSGHSEKYLPRLAALRSDQRLAMNWLNQNAATLQKQDGKTPNRLLFDGLAFLLNGRILSDKKLISQGTQFIESAMATVKPDGVIPEHGGHDTSYQAVSILNLSIAYLYIGNGSAKDRIGEVLPLAAAWELSRISEEGEVSVKGNTRTGLGQENFFGNAKGVNLAEVAVSLFYWSQLSRSKQAADKAEKVVVYMRRK